MSIEKITSAIIDEAQAECEQILNAADTKNRSVITQLKKRIKIETDIAVKNAQEEREQIISRRKSVADIDSKKIILAKKQELINECFEKAVDYIISLEENRYVDFLVRTGKAAGISEGSLIFNEKERAAIGQRVVDGLNKAVPDGKFLLADETKKIKGGYMLRKGQIYINNSVEAMVQDKRRELTAGVAEILFPPKK